MISTGLVTVDHLLRGGFPTGVTDVYGEEATGKTALGMQVLLQAQRELRPTVFASPIRPDKNRLLHAGIDRDTPVILCDTWVQLTLALCAFMETSCRLVAVVDNVSVLETEEHLGKGLTEQVDHLGARLEVNTCLSGICAHAEQYDATIVLLSDARALFDRCGKVRTALNNTWNEVVACRLQLKQAKTVMAYGELHSKLIDVRVERSVAIPPCGNARVALSPRTGFNRYLEWLRYLSATNQATKKGNYWILSDGSKLGPGLDEALRQLEAYANGKGFN